jgi:putative zinc finger/helix-turn-helix YgiT family protein
MTCYICGCENVEERSGTTPLKTLPTTIVEGVIIYECPACGDRAIEFPRLGELMDALARLVVEDRSRLSGEQIRFLRNFLDLSQEDLAHRLGIAPSTLSRCETGSQLMGVSTDRLLRVMVAWQLGLDDFASKLDQVAVGDAEPWHARLRFDEGWKVIDDAPGAKRAASR